MTGAGWAAAADVVVVGTGVAGLTAALEARDCGLRVLVVTKAGAGEGNTRWAQGGVAVAGAGEHGADSVARHAADTVAAGGGICDEFAVRAILAGGPAAVAALRRRGAVFDPGPDGRPARTREGGHSAWRVIHAGGDATGAEIERALLAAAAGVPVLARHAALEVLLTADGAVAGLAVLGPDGGTAELHAPAVLLATGGLGQLYASTTNPEVATGDGLALALRAGAALADVEFVQFHPTVLYTGAGARGRRPLVTEAVRGEGAVLVTAGGAPLMAGVHPLADLAPRDVVAAAITRRMAADGTDHVYLDATHLGAAAFARRFPTVHAACAAAGIDPAREPIPVAPAAHYGCGGVLSTVDGRTAVRGLYTAGEVARTGLHGANRLASNSLLEGLVVGTRAARAVAADTANHLLRPAVPAPARRPALVGAATVAPCADRDAVQRAMSRHAGVGRDRDGLATALAAVAAATALRPVRTRTDIEDAALAVAATALLTAAAARSETRGCHVRTDHPLADDGRWRRSTAMHLDERGRLVLTGPACHLAGRFPAEVAS